MDVRQLRYLVRIVELKSFTSAAESLHIAPSALGVQVRNLEEELGVQLLLRHARGVSPTAAGEVLVEHGRRILAAVETAAHSARSASAGAQATGHVSIGLTPPINDFLSMALLNALKASHPELRVAIVEAPGLSLSTLVLSRELDLACAYDVRQHDDLVADQLMEDDFVFFQSASAGGASGPITFEAATRSALVLPASSHGSRMVLDKEAQRRGIRLNVAYEVQSLVAVRELVLSGQAAAIVPFASVVRHVGDKRLQIRPLIEPRISRPLWLIRSRLAASASCSTHDLAERASARTVARPTLDAVASIFTDLLFKEIALARSVLQDSFTLAQ
jgi:LysR family nitrogen assimilation transcriptional regulator